MNEIDRLLIERACTQLMIDYNIYNDSMDIESFLTLWTDDCVFARVVPQPAYEVHGHAGLRTAMDQIIVKSGLVRRHMMVNPRITIHGPDSAEGFCIGLAVSGPAGDGTLPVPLRGIELVGEYRDQYRRTDAGWKIARRELTRVIDATV